MKLEKYLLLNLKKLLLIIGAFILAVLLHNLVYALFFDYFSRTGGDEAFFFIIAIFVIPLYFLVSVGYTIFHHVRKRIKKK
ncbi:hypothetical protein KY332_00440 [Candidatus Woesearchaeota archaeon]|nr:hypothetical protein [Candidatus Woesearchaeota archaeon]